MSNVKSAILQLMIEGILTDIFLKTSTDNVVMTVDGNEVTLATKLSEIMTAMSGMATKEAAQQYAKNECAKLVNGAPETMDTLKEVSDYLVAHKDVTDALNAAIGNKVDKVEGKGLSANDFTDAYKAALDGLGALASKDKVTENDLDAALKAKVNATENVIETVKVNGVAVPVNDKAVDLSIPVVYAQATTPANMKAGDLLLKIVQ